MNEVPLCAKKREVRAPRDIYHEAVYRGTSLISNRHPPWTTIGPYT